MRTVRAAAARAIAERGGMVHAHDLRARLRYLIDLETLRGNRRVRRSGPPDGMSLPPPRLVHRVAGHFDLEEYYESGRIHAELFRRVLATHGVEVDTFRTLLDFGCGCGRIIMHWKNLPRTRVHGTDYNAELVTWCREALAFAEFRQNGPHPPLTYPDGYFDFIYANSVFTHLPEGPQRAWIAELSRVLAPAGILLVTTKGASRVGALGEEDRRRFASGELVVLWGRSAGKNLCAAFHPERYVRDVLAGDLEVISFVPADGAEHTQDIFLLQRQTSSERSATTGRGAPAMQAELPQ